MLRLIPSVQFGLRLNQLDQAETLYRSSLSNYVIPGPIIFLQRLEIKTLISLFEPNLRVRL